MLPPLIAAAKVIGILLIFSVATDLLPEYRLVVALTALASVAAVMLEAIWQGVK